MNCPTLGELPPSPPGKTGWPWSVESKRLPDVMPDGRPWPRISIVTPSYNQERFIEETIRSVLLQGYPDLEYIIIDGGSTDRSAEIIRKYEPWLAYWVSEPDHGQADAINKGWRMARGEIVTYLNSDDIYLPGTAQEVIGRFERYPEADVVLGDCYLIDENSNVVDIRRGKDFEYVSYIRMCRNFVHQSSSFLKRGVLDRVGLLDPTLEFALDFDYWCRAGQVSTIQYVPGVLSSTRIHSASKTSRIKGESAGEFVTVYEKLFSQSILPSSVVAIRAEAMGSAYARAAEYTYAALLPPKTRWYFRRAFCLYPRHILNLELIGKYLISLFGTSAMSYSLLLYQRLTGQVVF